MSLVMFTHNSNPSEWLREHCKKASNRRKANRDFMQQADYSNVKFFKVRSKPNKNKLSIHPYKFKKKKEVIVVEFSDSSQNIKKDFHFLEDIFNHNKKMIIKDPDDFWNYDFLNKNVLELIQTKMNFRDIFAAHQWLLQNFYIDDYKTKKEIFCAKIIAEITGKSAIKYYQVEANDTPYVGSLWNDNYKDWSLCRHMQPENGVLGNIVDQEGYILVNSSSGNSNRFPIKNLGVSALARLILGIQDLHGSNWGLVQMDTYYQATLLDFGQCLVGFTPEKITPETIENLIDAVYHAHNRKFQENNDTVPKEILNAAYIKEEIFSAIYKFEQAPHIHPLKEKICKLAAHILHDYPYHAELHLRRIEQSIDLIITSANQLPSYLAYKTSQENKKYEIAKAKYEKISGPAYIETTSTIGLRK